MPYWLQQHGMLLFIFVTLLIAVFYPLVKEFIHSREKTVLTDSEIQRVDYRCFVLNYEQSMAQELIDLFIKIFEDGFCGTWDMNSKQPMILVRFEPNFLNYTVFNMVTIHEMRVKNNDDTDVKLSLVLVQLVSGKVNRIRQFDNVRVRQISMSLNAAVLEIVGDIRPEDSATKGMVEQLLRMKPKTNFDHDEI